MPKGDYRIALYGEQSGQARLFSLSYLPHPWDVNLLTIQLLLLECHNERNIDGLSNFITEVIRNDQLNLSRNITTLCRI